MKFSNTEIVIEMAGEKNQNFLFGSFEATLRGRWNPMLIRDTSTGTDYGSLPIIPGIYVAIDLKKRTLRAIDPLGFPENADALAAVDRVVGGHQGGRRGPADTMTRNNMTETELKTGLWEMHQWVESNKAVVVNGTMPEPKEILALPGELLIRRHFVGENETPYATPEEITRLEGGRPVGIERTRAAMTNSGN